VPRDQCADIVLPANVDEFETKLSPYTPNLAGIEPSEKWDKCE